ncbi:MAG: DUF29 domain-containing protein [Candidatus Competibacteraceae bacterium]|nr:DUF29 domain-containing protein [Candidatus Competibacteraceae bacterium]
MGTESLFDRDFYRWTQDQAALIREGRLSEIDLEHVAEELESMGARERRELISRLAVLLAHLLKWQYQPERRSRSWRLTINEQRRQLELLLEDSPSLRANLTQYQSRAYRNAVQSALDETGFVQSPFPVQCPYTPDQTLDTGFWPQ